MMKTIENRHYFAILVVLAMVTSLILGARPSYAADLTVTNTNDSGTGSLRQAILDANASVGEDTIRFAIPGTGVHTISPQSNLPEVTGDTVAINGFSQPGSSANSLSKGTNAKPKIELEGSGIKSITPSVGLRISAPFSFVTGLVINRFETGVEVSAGNVLLTQNFVGTDPTGTLDRGNSGAGVSVGGFGSSIGLSPPQSANLISGNDGAGVSIGGQATRTGVTHNLIGTDRSGAKGLGNARDGVRITDSSLNDIESNTIAFNGGDGVGVEGGGARGVEVGDDIILGNSIFSNGGIGINLINPNISIPAGESLGPTANDPGDKDLGPNELQNKPVLTSAAAVSGQTTVKGKINSHPDETYTIQFFSNPVGGDEGKTFLDQKTVTTDGAGNASFTFSSTAARVGQNITATATKDLTQDTSEFSAPTTVNDATHPTVKSVSPAENATGVSLRTNVSAVFSEAMQASTVNATTVTLRKAGTTKRVAANVAYSSASKKATLNPDATLTPGASYVATVSTGAKDKADNALDQNPVFPGNQAKVWKFTVKK